jgi:hypothetical protein
MLIGSIALLLYAILIMTMAGFTTAAGNTTTFAAITATISAAGRY